MVSLSYFPFFPWIASPPSLSLSLSLSHLMKHDDELSLWVLGVFKQQKNNESRSFLYHLTVSNGVRFDVQYQFIFSFFDRQERGKIFHPCRNLAKRMYSGRDRRLATHGQINLMFNLALFLILAIPLPSPGSIIINA